MTVIITLFGYIWLGLQIGIFKLAQWIGRTNPTLYLIRNFLEGRPYRPESFSFKFYSKFVIISRKWSEEATQTPIHLSTNFNLEDK